MNPSEQLERLLSERRDGGLTAEQLAEVERAIAADTDAAAVEQQYARLGVLLAKWRPSPEGVDWAALARRTGERVAEEAADQSLEPLLEKWAQPLPDVDWEALKSRISQAVRQEAGELDRRTASTVVRWRRAASWVARVGVPLAAAAAIALLVWWPRGSPTPVARHGGPTAEPVVTVALVEPGTAGRVSVKFEGDVLADTTKTDHEPDWVPEGGLKFVAPAPGELVPEVKPGVVIAVGPSSVEVAEPEETTDEALLY